MATIEMERKIKMYEDKDYGYIEAIEAIVDLKRATEYEDMYKAFVDAINGVRYLANSRFEALAKTIATKSIEETRESAIHAQGGL